MASDNGNLATPQPGMGKWNRSKRRLKLQQEPHRKKKITKEERREKYTAIAKERQAKKQQKDLICFRCRQKGHSIQYCTNAAAVGNDDNDDVEPNNNDTKTVDSMLSQPNRTKKRSAPSVVPVCCYRCGSTEHNLASCPEHKNSLTKKKNKSTEDLPFATCFICQERGHIASQCVQNQHGIYIQGTGQCKYCQSKLHRASQCPDKQKSTVKGTDSKNDRLDDFDASELLEGGDNQSKPISTNSIPTTRRSRVVNF